ncbi:MAG: hypothetical protein QOE59_2837, partial [Actinomycetota bacterium]|nr:hypothetical protein [Actinomycetota bacterium]
MGTTRGSLHRVRRGVGRITSVSLPGVLASGGPVPASVPRTARPRPRPGRTLGVLVAVALGAMAVVALVVPRVPVLAEAVGLAPAPPTAAAAPPVTVTAVVTATASCVSADPHDQIVMNLGGSARQAVLDGCGRAPGTPVPVVVPADGRITGPVAVAGSGAQTPSATTDVAGDGVSPLVARLQLALAVAAALGAGSLLVVVARGNSRGAATSARRRPAARTRAGGVPAQRSRALVGPARRTTGPHAVRPTRVRTTTPGRARR